MNLIVVNKTPTEHSSNVYFFDDVVVLESLEFDEIYSSQIVVYDLQLLHVVQVGGGVGRRRGRRRHLTAIAARRRGHILLRLARAHAVVVVLRLVENNRCYETKTAKEISTGATQRKTWRIFKAKQVQINITFL